MHTSQLSASNVARREAQCPCHTVWGICLIQAGRAQLELPGTCRVVLANALPIDPRVMLVFAVFVCFWVWGAVEVLGGGGASFFLSDDVHYLTEQS